MRVLFLTVSTGHGHTSSAKAIEKYLNDSGAETFFLDVYGYISPRLCNAISKIYLFAAGKTPRFYGKQYDHADMGKSGWVEVVAEINHIIKNKFIRFIEENEIDVVIASHLFAAQILTMIRGQVDIRTIGIVTDYTVHPKWENTNLDYYVIADKSLIPLAGRKGINKDKLLPIGIPVDMKFSVARDKNEAKKELGFDVDRPLVFVMMGSMGYGNIYSVIREIDRADIDCNVAVCCGNNKRAKALIDRTVHKKNFKTYGFINNVDMIMDAADCLITKPGGLSVTESLSKKLPMIFVDPIPGQEYRNVEFLVNNGVGLYTTKSFTVEDALNIYFNDSERRKEIKNAVERLSKPNSAKDIGDFILSFEKGK
ncbi:MAG: glycosyltransferase [Monoglobales bacterium]